MMIQTRTINKALAAKGIKAELIKGEGYFYFIGDDVDCNVDGVYVFSLNELTLDRWIDEAVSATKPRGNPCSE